MRNKELRNKIDTISIRVLSTQPGIHFLSKPTAETVTIGRPDTLFFVTNVTGGAAVPASYTLSVTPEIGTDFFKLEYSSFRDSVWVTAAPPNPGIYSLHLVAATHYNETILTDTAIVTVTVQSSETLSTVHAPQQLITGKPDTLLFVVDNTARPNPLTISLISKSPLDPTVFSIVPSGTDSILIAIASTATPGAADIGIITSNSMETDTTWYPVTLISQADALWNTTEINLDAIEGSPLTIDLKPYLSAADAQGITFATDAGAISSDLKWSFTPPWGCDPTMDATLTATKGSVAFDLEITLKVAAGDTGKPALTISDPSLDGKKVSGSQITVECEATDAGAGIGSVTFTSGTQTVPATLQHDAVYSGVITGLVHGSPAQITITATDKSRTKNSASLTVTVTRDSTLTDAEAPTIVQLAGPKSGDRVTGPSVTLQFSVTDNSGIDSVWWTLNNTFMAAIAASNNSYTISYSLTTFGENVIALQAKDGSVNGNNRKQTLTLNYNTEPAAITLTSPAANETGVAKVATFKWNGGDDADGEAVTYTVRYGTSQISLNNTATVSGQTATAPLDYNTTYFWQVTAKSGSTMYLDSVKSPVGSFTTGGNLPTISAHPQSQTKEVGQSVTFSVTASANGFGTLSYQWRENGANVGTNSASYMISSVTTAMSGKTYDCVVTNDVGDSTSSKATLTVTAIPTFTVSFVTDGGTPKPGNQTIARGGYATKPTTNPVRTGYKFTGWYELNATHDFYFTSTAITADLTIYAGWVDVYTVTYHKRNDESGSAPTDTNKYTSYSDVPIKSNDGSLYKNGYTFKGWTLNEDGSGTIYTTGSIQIGLSNIDLYAKWEEIRYTITYSVQGGMGSHSNPTYYTPLKVITFTGATKDGYIFDGWYDSPQYQNKITSTAGLNKAITIYGRWIVAKGAVNYLKEITDYGTNNFTLSAQESQGGYTDYSIKVDGHEVSSIGYDVTFTTELGCNPDVYYYNGACSFHFTAIAGPCQNSWGSYCSFVIYKSN